MQQCARQALVAFDDDVGRHLDGLAEDALQRRPAAIDGRTYLLDECPATSVLWQFHVEFGGKGDYRSTEQVLCPFRVARARSTMRAAQDWRRRCSQ
jgi:hypothetical protein